MHLEFKQRQKYQIVLTLRVWALQTAYSIYHLNVLSQVNMKEGKALEHPVLMSSTP